MTDLLLNADLRTSKPDDEVRAVAQARTLSVLRSLDGGRKGLSLQFVYDAGLVALENPVLAMNGADLSLTDLRGADLEGANLHMADLREANLDHANLRGANVTDKQLATAKSLRGAIMHDGIEHE